MSSRKIAEDIEKEYLKMRANQRECTHSWSDPKQVKVNQPIPYETNQQWHGTGDDMIVTSDTEWRDNWVKAWERECSKCGKVETTTKEAPATYKPKFD